MIDEPETLPDRCLHLPSEFGCSEIFLQLFPAGVLRLEQAFLDASSVSWPNAPCYLRNHKGRCPFFFFLIYLTYSFSTNYLTVTFSLKALLDSQFKGGDFLMGFWLVGLRLRGMLVYTYLLESLFH